MGRNTGDFKVGTEPSHKDVIKAHVGNKITWEEAADLSPKWNDVAGGNYGVSNNYKVIGKNVPNLRSTSEKKTKDTHKNAGLDS